MKGKTKIGTWVGFLLILVWCLFPVAWILSLSFKSEGETAVGSPQFLPKDPTFDNYKALWDWPWSAPTPPVWRRTSSRPSSTRSASRSSPPCCR